ncbi:MAG TPA: enoyl-CoA hydratase-related protein [Candidatus Binataceae bacterium]|nr:enoyl-CoA hydratase-related protein [Candidatus Binataceae bacterium]
MPELLFELRGEVAHLTLNRPEAANALNLELAQQLEAAALRCDEDPAVRAVLLTGAGKIFCAGGDLKAFAAEPAANLPAYLKKVTLYIHQAVHRFARMKAPLIVAVNGNAGGGGMSVALAGDLVLAGESARFTMAYTRVGLTPDGSSSYFLPRLIGLRRTMELALTNRVLTAREAEALGLITRAVPDAELMTQAQALANELAQGATRAFGGVKRLLYASANTTLGEQMALESETIAEMARTRDGQEGIAAFIAKRAPKFNGQ